MRYRLGLAAAAASGLVAVALPTPAWAAGAGSLDPTFGSGGKVFTDFGGEDVGYGMALQADGKTVVAGYARNSSSDFALARYNADGSPDEAFGHGGKTVTDIGGNDVGRAVAVQTDGKIVVAGSTSSAGPTGFALARYKVDGTLDESFGDGGVVHTDVSGKGRYGVAYAVAIEANGDIVAAGSVDGDSGTDFGVARYLPNGVVDSTFGHGGTVLTDLGGGDNPRSVAVGSGGTVVVAGDSNARGSNDFAAVRYRSDGSLDPTFGAGGTVLTDLRGTSSYEEGRSVTVQPDGAVVLAGSSNANGTMDFALAKYRSNGALDTSFGTGGTVLTDVKNAGHFEVALAVTLTPDNDIVAAGVAGLPRNTDFTVARYHADGSLDSAFGKGGTAVVDVAGIKASDTALAVASRPDKRIVVAGSASRNGGTDFALAQFLG